MLSPLLLLSLVAVSLASPLGRGLGDFQVKHAWDAVPAGWEYHSPAPADHVLHMHFALKQGKFDELLRHLAEVSEPQHERYGQVRSCPISLSFSRPWLKRTISISAKKRSTPSLRPTPIHSAPSKDG